MTEAIRQARKLRAVDPATSASLNSPRIPGEALQPKQPHPWSAKQQGSMAECVKIHGEGCHFNIGEDGQAQPVTSRPVLNRWRRPQAGSLMDRTIRYDPDGFNPRFDGPGRVVHHVKDGQPLTERGAELLKERG